MTEPYTFSSLKKHIVNLSKIDPSDSSEATQFIARYPNSIVSFSVPQVIILALGRLFQKKLQLELGYLLKEDIWYVLEEGSLLWSNKFLPIEENSSNFNRYTALKENPSKKS